MIEGRKRVSIEGVRPEIDCGRFPVKRVVGETVCVEADVFADGHDQVVACLMYRKARDDGWHRVIMDRLENDRWRGSFRVDEMGTWVYTVCGWVDHFQTWQADLRKRIDAGQEVKQEFLIGVGMIEAAKLRAGKDVREIFDGWCRNILDQGDHFRSVQAALSGELTDLMSRHVEDDRITFYEKELAVRVDREKAGFSSWYEVFPRSWGEGEGHGTFRDLERQVPGIAEMGFDVLYLSPIHPIGMTNRKGRNNAIIAEAKAPGCPWAIGSEEGGHKAIHPALGTEEDFLSLIRIARDCEMEIALDLAFQCSPDHPYVRDHPEWFRWRPDGTIQYAENPPKKYEDIVPFDFECLDWQSLWEELRSVVFHWIGMGVRIFRTDNPHTKPFAFWEWLLDEVRREHPDVLFLSEAFTRPRVMARLAKAGFSQSYTYFTWRNTKAEVERYLMELTKGELREYFRPNFWPNTPDILPQLLQFGGRAAFVSRLVLAATLSSNYGIYGPVFELCVSEAMDGREEYADSEKYEIKRWDVNSPGNLRDLIARVNRIRKGNPALRKTCNLKFYEVDNDQILFFEKSTEDLSNVVMVAVSVDPFHRQSGAVRVPLGDLGIGPGDPYLLHELIGDERCLWQGEVNRVDLDPAVLPVRIFRVHRTLRRESDFDYFM